MIRRPPRSTRTDTLFPYTTLFRSAGHLDLRQGLPAARDDRARAGREDIAAFEQRRDVRVVLPLLEGLPRLEFRIAVIKAAHVAQRDPRSEEHTSELQSLMRISYAVFCLKKKNTKKERQNTTN